MKRRENSARVLRRHRARERELQRILRQHPDADADNVWHTLVLLELPPIERLRRGLLRGQTIHRRTATKQR